MLRGGFVLIEPGVTYRGNERNLQTDFPYTNVQQYYGASERPVHYAFLTKPFFLSQTEVTVGEFRKFVEATGYVTEAEKSGRGIVGWSPSDERGERRDFAQKPEFTWKNPGFEQTDDHPVVGVSWTDAKAYCDWLSRTREGEFRLPTEAEWEMAARGGSKRTHFYWGDEVHGEIQRYANIGNAELEKTRELAAIRHWAFDVDTERGDGYVFTAPVGSFQPNAWGLHDVSGNVLEWCEDYFKFTYYDHWMPKKGPNPVAVDPVNHSEKDSAANEFRVVRGGSWYLGPLSVRCSARNFFEGTGAAAYIGFRVVREATREEKRRYGNPYDVYQTNLEALQKFGASFQPLNRAAEIHLPRKPVTPALIRAIAGIPGLHRIKGVEADPFTQEHINALAQIDRIEILSLRGNGLANVDLSAFAKAQPAIENLDFSSTGVTDAHLGQLSPIQTLRHVTMSCAPDAITDAGLRRLAGNSKLRSLRIHHAEVSGTFLEAFVGLPLKSLAVNGARNPEAAGGWTRSGSAALARFVPGLIELGLARHDFRDADLEPLKSLERLGSLDLSGCAMPESWTSPVRWTVWSISTCRRPRPVRSWPARFLECTF